MNQHTQELEKNELVEWANSKFGHLKPHLGKILLVFVLIVVLGFAFAYYRYLQSELYAAQWRQLQMAIHGQMVTSETSDYAVMAEQYPDAKASMWAMQLAGDSQLRQGLSRLISDRNAALKELGKAKASYGKILESKVEITPMLRQRALYTMAYTCESMGEFDEAKKYYGELVEKVPDSAFAKQADRALERLADPAIRKVWEEFKTVGTAPGEGLPTAPDISFPEIPAATGDQPPATDGQPPATEPPAAEPPITDSADQAKETSGGTEEKSDTTGSQGDGQSTEEKKDGGSESTGDGAKSEAAQNGNGQ
jgi:tetratricopeptide (TPR) repeat protein